jgi:hypothetical protein
MRCADDSDQVAMGGLVFSMNWVKQAGQKQRVTSLPGGDAGKVGNNMHQQGPAVVGSTMPQPNSHPQRGQVLIPAYARPAMAEVLAGAPAGHRQESRICALRGAKNVFGDRMSYRHHR